MSHGEAVAEISTIAIMRRSFELLQENARRSSIGFIMLTALGVAIDSQWLGIDYEPLLTFLFSVLTLVLQYWLTRFLLDDLGMLASRRARFPAFFALALLSTVVILVGLIALINPGLILLVRWWISVPILLTSDESVINALRESWAETEGHFWPIFLTLAACYLLAIIVAMGAMMIEGLPSAALIGSVIMNIALNIAILVGWHVAVAIYTLTRPRPILVEVFA